MNEHIADMVAEYVGDLWCGIVRQDMHLIDLASKTIAEILVRENVSYIEFEDFAAKMVGREIPKDVVLFLSIKTEMDKLI